MRRAAALMLLLSLPAHAGRPLNTEDAVYLENEACQVESWIDRSRDATFAWMVPACNFGFGIEWQAGFGRLDFEGLSRLAESYVQAKTAWGTLKEGGWSVGLVAGVARRKLDEADHKWDNPYVTIPLSLGFDEALTLVHVNVGWTRERALGRDFTTWGLAAEREPLRSLRVHRLPRADAAIPALSVPES